MQQLSTFLDKAGNKMVKLDIKHLSFGDVKRILKGERFLITHNGKVVFGIISPKDFMLLESLEMEYLQSDEDRFDLEDINMK